MLGAAAAVLALPGGASASTKSQTTTLTTVGQVVTVTPKCGHGQRATGGGFQASQSLLGISTPKVVIDESRKIGQRSWRVSAQETVASGVKTVIGFVYCRSGAPKTKEKSATATSPGGLTFFSADASCSSGKAQAGGFSVPPESTTSNLLSDSFRVDKNTWRTRASNAASGAGHALATYVYCADAAKPKARSGSASSGSDNAPATAVSAGCKHNTHVVAGGFSQPDANRLTSYYSFAYESFRSGNAWRASAIHSGVSSTTLNAIALCG
jgi:hypothetical protein